MDSIVLKKLDMPDKPKDMTYWHEMVERILKHYDRKVTIAVLVNMLSCRMLTSVLQKH